MHRNHYFFNRKDPSTLTHDKRYLTIVDHDVDDSTLLSEIEKFLEEHEVYTINMDDDTIIVTFGGMDFTMVIYPDESILQQIFVEIEDWEGDSVEFAIPIGKFGIYADGIDLIIGDLI